MAIVQMVMDAGKMNAPDTRPLRPELSTASEINISMPVQSIGTSLACSSTEEYQTEIYGDEVATAEAMAQGIMLANVVSKEQLSDAEQVAKESGRRTSPATRQG